MADDVHETAMGGRDEPNVYAWRRKRSVDCMRCSSPMRDNEASGIWDGIGCSVND